MVLLESRPSCSKPSLAAVCARIREISTLPHVAMQVMQVAADPEADAGRLNEVMEVDAAITIRVLRYVNSSAYGLRRTITNLREAIAYLGLVTVRQLAVSASVSQLFRKEAEHGRYNRRGLWRHLVAVGTCARLIALRTRCADFEDVFLAGLLHDVGVILEDQHLHASFLAVIDALKEGTTLAQSERVEFDFDHCSLGGMIAESWKIPAAIVDTIRHHHDSAGYAGASLSTVRSVEIANYLCSAKGLSSVGTHQVQFPRDAILGLGLGKTDLVVIAEDLDQEMANNPHMLET